VSGAARPCVVNELEWSPAKAHTAGGASTRPCGLLGQTLSGSWTAKRG
jgi:hypothetical protein